MQHDLFHVYTVDQHILMVVRNLRRFTMREHAHEYPFCSQLMANFAQPWLLYIAALFHDIAKGRGGDHSKLGMDDARRFCRDHALSDAGHRAGGVPGRAAPDDVARGAEAGHVRSRRDQRLSPRMVKDERHLTALYLLTVADIRGTSPKVWNAWKGQAARRPVPDDAARARRRGAIGRPRAEEPPGRGAGDAAAVRPAGACARRAVAAARRRLLPAPRRIRHRLADAHAVQPARQPTRRW